MKISSEGEAKELVHEMRVRRECLTIFADSLTEANIYGRDKWAVTYTTSKIRLHVGHVIVCTLENGCIWMALDKALLETANLQSLLEQSDNWKWDINEYPEYASISSRNGYYLPSEEYTEMWPGIRRLHFESIYRAANKTTIDSRTPKSHSPEILRYLRNELGRHVPDPLY